MSIATLAQTVPAVGEGQQQPPSPVFFNLVNFHGDNAYPTNGTPGFRALIQALFGDGRTVLAVVPQDCGGYTAAYDSVADKLKVWAANNTEVANATDLSGVTFNLLVISF